MTDPATPPTGDYTEPLPIWARVTAIALGAGGVAAGGVAVFVSSNQAGTAFLLLIGAVLMVLGIQGTPLRRLAKVAAALRRVGATTDKTTTVRGAGARRIDAVASVDDGNVPIEIVYQGRGPVMAPEIGTTRSGAGTVVITNAPASPEVSTPQATTGPGDADVEVVTWNDARDDDVLAAALTRNARQ